MSIPAADVRPPIDAGIMNAVTTLQRSGVETFESCEGGDGHCFAEPTVRFHGDREEGFRALGVAMRAGLPVFRLYREWCVIDGEPTGPCWVMTFKESVRSYSAPPTASAA